MCLKPTDSSTPSALPELSLPVSSPSDLGTVMEVTICSLPRQALHRVQGLRKVTIYIYIYILKDTEGLKKLHTVLCFALIYFPKRSQRYTKCLLETVVLPISHL